MMPWQPELWAWQQWAWQLETLGTLRSLGPGRDEPGEAPSSIGPHVHGEEEEEEEEGGTGSFVMLARMQRCCTQVWSLINSMDDGSSHLSAAVETVLYPLSVMAEFHGVLRSRPSVVALTAVRFNRMPR
jgi:hypothetical protein